MGAVTMTAERFDYAIFALRKEIGIRRALSHKRIKAFPNLGIAERVRTTLEEFEERDREIAQLRAAIRCLGG